MNRLLTLARDVRSLQFSRDGAQLLATFRDDAWENALGGAWIDPHTGLSDHAVCVINAADLAFLPDGSGFVYGVGRTDWDMAEVRWFDLASGEHRRIVGNIEAWLTRVTVARDGGTILVEGTVPGADLRRFDLRPWGETEVGGVVLVYGSSTTAVSPDGARAATVHRFADAFTVTELKTMTRLPLGPVPVCVIWPADDRLISLRADGQLDIWDGESTTPLLSISEPGALVICMDASPDGRWIAVGCADGVVRVWGMESPEPVAVFDWGIGEIWAIAFAPDGLTCAAAGSRGKVVVWDFEM